MIQFGLLANFVGSEMQSTSQGVPVRKSYVRDRASHRNLLQHVCFTNFVGREAVFLFLEPPTGETRKDQLKKIHPLETWHFLREFPRISSRTSRCRGPQGWKGAMLIRRKSDQLGHGGVRGPGKRGRVGQAREKDSTGGGNDQCPDLVPFLRGASLS